MVVQQNTNFYANKESYMEEAEMSLVQHYINSATPFCSPQLTFLD